MLEVNADQIFYGVLGFMWLEFLWEAYIGSRQRKIYKTQTTVPSELTKILDEDTFTKARLYALDRSSFGSIQGLFSQVLSTGLLYVSGYKIFWDLAGDTLNHFDYQGYEILQSLLFTLYLSLFSTVIGLPFTIYSTFVIEERHGFNKQTAGFFVKDQIKKFIVGQLIQAPILAGIIKIVYWGGDHFYLYLWLFAMLMMLFLMTVYPDLIAPLFDKYTPLPEGELKTGIEELAAKIEFPLYKLYVVEGSKRSSHSNAYFYGFYKFKRIVLFDTLLEIEERKKIKESIGEEWKEEDQDEKSRKSGCNKEEILAVLGHELGHWKLNHVLKNIILAQVQIFLMFLLFAYLSKAKPLYVAFGFSDSTPVLIGLMIVLQYILAPYSAVVNFLMTVLSRKFEFQADRFAAELGLANDLGSALIKLNIDNLSFPIYDWLYSAWNHSHPPLLERLDALKKYK
eukprot:TRINITY_DN11294_c0_g2_i1.p1 TRINITY_DN11294_c0_g2~~TRINITY_DN11294_c0_g2_i1.p1  ORF type:complete len:453 (+),score=109.63 TRINITY_DN11294_c0_g2_i1:44-1402(+)